MTTSLSLILPKLRAVDIRPVAHAARPALWLRDPLGLSDRNIIIPHALAPALALCDGTRDSYGLRVALVLHFGLPVGAHVVDQLLAALDEALLLENDRFRQALAQALEAYRQAPFRSPTLAGASYPADPADLGRLLQGYLDAVDGSGPPLLDGRGLISPHIDFARGGPVYAAVWQRAANMIRSADLVVLLGTDHYGDDLITLTRQHYATPFGILPTAVGVVEALAQAIGPEQVFAGELRHRSEHSIEMAAVWLQFACRGDLPHAGIAPRSHPPSVVPILCGSFAPFVQGQADPEHNPAICALVETLPKVTAGQRVCVVAAADLAHVGPAFGGTPLDLADRARLQAADEEIIGRVCAGDAAGFLDAIRREGDRNNVCGLPPIYLALRLLGATKGVQIAYDRCLADEQGTSLVSVCGVVLE
jgi:AmmeMemoRadiSam system protein B